jgi:hypothetical protein
VTDCPRLIGWSSLDLAHHRSLTSFVVIAGTDCRFQNRRAASRRASYDERFVHPRDRDHHPEGPCGATGATIRTPSVVSQSNRSRRFALTGLRTALASMVRKRRAIRAPFSPWSRRHVCQHVGGVLLGQRHAADSPCGSPDVATRDALDRLLPSHFFVRVPAHRGFPLRQALARQHSGGDRLLSRQCDSLRWACTDLPFGSSHHGGRCLPVTVRAFLTSDIPVASPAGRVTLARARDPRGPPRPP